MNLNLMIVASILIVTLVMCSETPAERDQRKREGALAGKDKLVESIKEYNSKPSFMRSLMGQGSNSSLPEEKPESPAPAPKQPIYPAQPSDQAMPPSQQKSEQPQGYYPPPPASTGQQNY